MNASEIRMQKLLQMEQAKPEDPFLKFAIAQELTAQQNIEAAEKYYAQLLEKFPDYLPTYYHFAKLKEGKNHFEQATVLYQKGIELAQNQGDSKTLAELKQALFLLDS